jgi:hypothetical protein
MPTKSKYAGLGIALGAALGAVAGVLAGHIAIWLAIGLAIGMTLGAARVGTGASPVPPSEARRQEEMSFQRQEKQCPQCAAVHRTHQENRSS